MQAVKCSVCGITLKRRIRDDSSGYWYCAEHRGYISIRGNATKYKEYIERWKRGEESGMRGKTSISAHIRKYLFEKYDNKCSKCGWSEVNEYTGNIPLEINHIDGEHTHNTEDNLELICSNCHSLTPNYRALNNGHGRPR